MSASYLVRRSVLNDVASIARVTIPGPDEIELTPKFLKSWLQGGELDFVDIIVASQYVTQNRSKIRADIEYSHLVFCSPQRLLVTGDASSSH